jgi:hypothetical protein
MVRESRLTLLSSSRTMGSIYRDRAPLAVRHLPCMPAAQYCRALALKRAVLGKRLCGYCRASG